MTAAVTVSYQQSLAAALQSISPSLAALHNTKVKPTDASTSSITCAHCGTYLIPGQGSIGFTRKTRRHRAGTTTLRIRISCHVCGRTDFKPLAINTGTRASFEPARTIGRRRKAHIDQRALEAAGPSTSSHDHVPSTPSTPVARSIRNAPTPDLDSPALPSPALSEPTRSRSASTQPSANTSRAMSPAASPSPSTTPKGGASRKKKKSSLQEMLERNRLQKQQKQQEREKGGLLGFLESF